VAESDDVSAVYAAFIEKELVDQRASKASMEQRCIAVVSTSGILVTVLFGFAAIARKSDGLHVPPSARSWFCLALGGFVVAAVTTSGTIPRGSRVGV
jgi:hypothetical protein